MTYVQQKGAEYSMYPIGNPNVENMRGTSYVEGLYKAFYTQTTPEVSRTIAIALGKISSDHVIAQIGEFLHHEREEIRERAIVALIHCNHQDAVPLLLDALQDPSDRVRTFAIQALGRKGSPEAIDALVHRINRQDSIGNEALLYALLNIGLKNAPSVRHTLIAQPFGKLLKDIRENPIIQEPQSFARFGMKFNTDTTKQILKRNQQFRESLLKTLEYLEWTPDQSELAAEYWIWKRNWNACIAIGSNAADPLIYAFKHAEDKETRERAYTTLVEIGSPAAHKLVQALSDDIADLRQAAYHALIKIGSAAVPELMIALQDEYAQVRQASIQGLGVIGDPVAIEAIIPLLSDPDDGVRKACHSTLLRFGKEAKEAMVQALSSSNNEVRMGATMILDELGWKPPKDKTGALYWIIRKQWVKCLEIGESAISPLLAELEQCEPKQRKQVLVILVKIGNTAVQPLIHALLNSQQKVWQTVIHNIAMIGGPQATYILKRLREESKDEEMVMFISQTLARK